MTVILDYIWNTAAGLINNFIYQPVLVPMAMEWEQKQMGRFMVRIIRQFMIIVGISVVCMVGVYVLGIPVLSILYHTDLSGYKRELLILLLGAAVCYLFLMVLLCIIYGMILIYKLMSHEIY